MINKIIKSKFVVLKNISCMLQRTLLCKGYGEVSQDRCIVEGKVVRA